MHALRACQPAVAPVFTAVAGALPAWRGAARAEGEVRVVFVAVEREALTIPGFPRRIPVGWNSVSASVEPLRWSFTRIRDTQLEPQK